MQVFTFQLMPYSEIDRWSIKGGAWLAVPNSHHDPETGHALYNRCVDELAAGLGFDGIGVNERHTAPAP